MKSNPTSLPLASIAAACTLLLFACNIAAAERSFDGVWELNLSKSKVTGETFTYEKRGDKIHFDSHGYTYDFDLSGKGFPEPDGQTVAARQIDPQTWEITHRAQGKTNFVARMSLNGDTLTAIGTITKADGSEAQSKETWTRVSGGPGLLGKWKSTDVAGTLTKTLEITTGPKNAVTMSFPEVKWICHAKFDGKDHPVTINGASPKTTVAFKRAGKNAFKTTLKNSGKPEYIDVWTLSSDGMTLIDDSTPASADEPTKLVFERK